MNLKLFLKWAGGKTQLLSELVKYAPSDFHTYYEPFLGAGALLFHLQPKNAVVADINAELINCYNMIRITPNRLMSIIDTFPVNKEFFYEMRSADRCESFCNKSDVWRAARLIYLNKTCFNGLYRVNKKGELNSTWGYKKSNTIIYETENLKAVSQYLNDNNVSIKAIDFQMSLMMPKHNDFVYLDPPYDILSDTSNFTGYTLRGFNKADQKVLKGYTDSLTAKGVKVLQSNADTPFIRQLYADYDIIEVQAKRAINSKASKRGAITELLIKNY